MKRKNLLLLILALLSSTMLFAQSVEISGTVLDEAGDPAIGAGVIVKGNSAQGTTTDLSGQFSIQARPGDVLVFSYIGYDDVEMPVTGTRRGVVITFSGSQVLDELVVVGYGVQKKSVMSSAVSRVTSETLDEGHPTDINNALKGKISGVVITSESGQPGSGSKIRIRGIGTVNDSSPLYIVDGMPSENGIDYLNPTDIESIEVLKDAASAAIYGSRGANGVVLVTTKEGAKGKTVLNYDFSYGIQNPAKKVELLGSEGYKLLINEMAVNSGKAPYITDTPAYNTDWQEVLQNKNAPIMNHRLSLSGGDDRSNYYISFGYLDQQGIYAKGYSNYTRYNVRAKYNNTIMDIKDRNWLNKATVGVNVSYARSKVKGTSIGNSEGGGLIASMNMLPPTEAVYQDDAAKLAQYAVNFPNAVVSPDGRTYNIIDLRDIMNPLAEMQVRHNQVSVPQSFNGNIALNADLLPGLKLRSTFGVDLYTSSWRSVTPVADLNTANKIATSTVKDNKYEGFHWQWENVLSYNKSFGKHNVGALAGTSLSSYTSSGIYGTDYDLLIADIDKAFIDTAAASEDKSEVSSNGYDHKLASFFARANYNYDERYLFEAVVRFDGSSNFAQGHRWSVFPSVSAGWVITREPFMENRPEWFDFAKLRASWGQNGNERVGSFKYTSMMRSDRSAVIDGKLYTGMRLGGYANADLKWETSEQIDLGLDLRFLNNALTLTVDWFQKTTKDMLLDKPIPLYTSFSTMTVNAGSVKNSGVELEATYRFATGPVNWSLGANASYLKNVVLDQGPDRIGLNQLGGGMGGQISFSQNGYPYGYFYGYKTDGVFQTDAEAAASNQTVGGTPHAGDLKFKDIAGAFDANGNAIPDGKVDANDRTMIGNPNPDWTFGFNLAASFKGFDVSAFFQGVAGNEIYRLYRRSNITLANFGAEWLQRWHGEGTSNIYPRIVEADEINYQISDLFVEDGSYLRFKVAQIGYTLPESITRKAGISALRFYLQGENLFTLTKYRGYDPEVGTREGLDGGTYPQARIFSAGVNIKF